MLSQEQAASKEPLQETGVAPSAPTGTSPDTPAAPALNATSPLAPPAGPPAPSSNSCESTVADLRAQLEQCEARVDELEKRLRGSQPKTSGLIPHVLIGPKLSLLGLPSPGVGIEAKLWQVVGISIEYGFIPRIGISDIEVKYGVWQGTLEVFPFRGAFFVGMLAAKYKFTATQTSSGQTVAETTIRSTLLGPQLGWRWVFSNGFFTGLDLGYGFALSYESTLTPSNAAGTIADIKKNADEHVQSGIPLVSLLQLGWFF